MTREEARIIASKLSELGFTAKVEKTSHGFQARGSTSFSGVLFMTYQEGDGFIQGLRYALDNLRPPSIR